LSDHPFVSSVRGEVLFAEPMARHTTFRIGGPADIFFRPEDEEDLIAGVKAADRLNLPLFFLGSGSNLLVRDGGIRGLVIQTTKLRGLEIREPLVRAEAGIPLPVLVAACCRRGLAGLEFATGIPGSFAGGLWMNAGAHGYCLGDLVEEVVVLTSNRDKAVLKASQLNFSYRSSCFQRKPQLLILKGTLRLRAGADPESLLEQVRYFQKQRKHMQPAFPSAGSIFRNPEGMKAGKIIESVGGKGLASGAARVSDTHGNFIVNRGGATAKDVIRLIEELRERVITAYGIKLELEVEVVGEDDNKE